MALKVFNDKSAASKAAAGQAANAIRRALRDRGQARIIAATAREYGYTVMTRDRALLDYAAQGYLSALAC